MIPGTTSFEEREKKSDTLKSDKTGFLSFDGYTGGYKKQFLIFQLSKNCIDCDCNSFCLDKLLFTTGVH